MNVMNIICFAKDWNEQPTSNNHVMRELARQGYRVLWLNSISTRAPKLSSGRDLKKIFAKVKAFFRGLSQVDERMWVYTPIVLPFPHSRLATALNRIILRVSIKVLRRKLEMKHFQLWTFLPNAGKYVGHLGERLSVYYCTDDWSQFSYVDGVRIAAMEASLCERVDLIFATACSLADRHRAHNLETHLAPHGVDHEKFSAALVRSGEIPQDLVNLPSPVLGFYGAIQDWVDLELIKFLASRHPEWSFVMIGDVFVDIAELRTFANVHFLGRRLHSQLPAYCRGFQVALLPQKVNGLTRHMNPIKLREYLCAGLPVVSTALPEVEHFSDLCVIARSYQAFEEGIIRELQADSAKRRRERSDRMRSECWTYKVKQLCCHVARVLAAKQRDQTFTVHCEAESASPTAPLECDGQSTS